MKGTLIATTVVDLGNEEARTIRRDDYAAFWLERAREELEADPGATLHHWTHANFSGGLTGWEDLVDEVYRRPMTFGEHLLRGEIRAVLLIAVENSLRKAERTKDTMDIIEAVRTVEVLGSGHQAAACIKVRLNRLCESKGKTLRALADSAGFGLLMGTCGLRW